MKRFSWLSILAVMACQVPSTEKTEGTETDTSVDEETGVVDDENDDLVEDT